MRRFAEFHAEAQSGIKNSSSAVSAPLRETHHAPPEIVVAASDGWLANPIRSDRRKTVQASYDEIMKALHAIAAGRQQLPIAAGSDFSGKAVGSDRVFTDDAMTGL